MSCARAAIAAAALLTLIACQTAFAEPVSYARREAAGVALHVIDVDLNDPSVVVSPAMAASGRGRSESFSHFVSRLRPTAAINGTFFSKRDLLPVGDIVVDGKVKHFGGMGTAVAFAADGVDVIRLPKSRQVDWSEHRAALAGGPLLVWDGYAKPLPGGEGFGDPHVFARSVPRTAVGVTGKNHLLLVTTATGSSLARLARALRELGAIYAVNLDGGSSCGMYHQGRMIRGASRSLTNVLAVYVKPDPKPRKPLRPPRGLDWREGAQSAARHRLLGKGDTVLGALAETMGAGVQHLSALQQAAPRRVGGAGAHRSGGGGDGKRTAGGCHLRSGFPRSDARA